MTLTSAHVSPARDWRGRLLTPRGAQSVLGIAASTVTTWHSRKERTQLHPGGISSHRGWPMFYEADLLALRDRMPIYGPDGERIVRLGHDRPEPVHYDGEVTVYAGSCLDVLRALPDASVHSVVTDPPYGLSEVSGDKLTTAMTAWVSGDRERVPDGRGFMGRAWDAFVPPPAVWDECFRVLKPGGHLVAFAGSRTYDLMGLSIRLAGFEIRDGLQWLYGSGFPKGLDVSKAIDRAAGAARVPSGAPTSLACEFVRRGVPCEGHGDGVEMSQSGATVHALPTAPATEHARIWDGWNTALKPGHEPIVLARRPISGTVAANVVAHATGGLNIGACRVGTEARLNRPGGTGERVAMGGGWRADADPTTAVGRWPSNILLDADAADALDSGAPTSRSRQRIGRRTGKDAGILGAFATQDGVTMGHDDVGGPSRFFTTFRYQAKAPSGERPRVVSDPVLRLRADLSEADRAYVVAELARAGVEVEPGT